MHHFGDEIKWNFTVVLTSFHSKNTKNISKMICYTHIYAWDFKSFKTWNTEINLFKKKLMIGGLLADWLGSWKFNVNVILVVSWCIRI